MSGIECVCVHVCVSESERERQRRRERERESERVRESKRASECTAITVLFTLLLKYYLLFIPITEI